MSRTKNALRIVASSVVQQVVIVICGLILPPMLISRFGSEVNGLVSTIKQMLTYFSIVSLGIGASCQVALYKPLASKDYKTINGILGATRIFFNRTGYVYTALLFGFAVVFSFISKSDISNLEVASLILITGAGSVCEFIFVTKYKVLVVADQKQYVVAKIQTEGTIVNTIASVILINFGCNIITVQIIATLVYVFRLFLLKRYVKQHYEQADFHAEPRFDLIKDRWQAFGFQVSDMIINYTPILLVSTMISLTEASIYAVYNMIFSSLSMIIGVFSSGFAPSFGNLMAENDRNKLEKAYSTFSFVYNLMAFWITTCAMTLICSFVSVYITDSQGVNYIIPALAVLFSLQSLFRNIRTPSNTLVQAAGRFKDNQKLNLAEAFANVILAVLLGKIFGLPGIILSGAVTGGIRSLLFIGYANKNILNKSSLKDALVLGLNLVLMTTLYYFFPLPNAANYFEWIVQGFQVAIVSGILFLLLNSMLNRESAMDLLNRVKQLLCTKN